jgi:hypothetical protein
MKNPITFEIPKIIYDECFMITDNNTKLFRKLGTHDETLSEVGIETHMRFFNIFNTLNIHQNAFSGKSSLFSTLRLMSKGAHWSESELSWLFVSDPIIKQIALMHYHYQKY